MTARQRNVSDAAIGVVPRRTTTISAADGELLENRREEPLRVDRRAEVAHVAGEHGIELRHQLEPAVHRRQAALLGLADLVADLAVERRSTAPRRRGGSGSVIATLCCFAGRMPGVARREVPQLQVLEPARRRLHAPPASSSSPRDVVRVRDDPAVVDERQRDAEAAEDRALEHHDRQNAGHRSAIGGREVDALVPERALEHSPPAPLVIAGRVRMALDERRPGGFG